MNTQRKSKITPQYKDPCSEIRTGTSRDTSWKPTAGATLLDGFVINRLKHLTSPIPHAAGSQENVITSAHN